MLKCRGCGEHMEFITSVKGHRIPVDPEPVQFDVGSVLDATYVSRSGVVFGKGSIVQNGDPLYISHFATCPKASDFRKKQNKKTEAT